ncbi:CDP-glycerol glycerophosphotransferase family protein [Streptomyces longhuiensis]|uniref:CDP-glycerol glycerophosphotransferase family protein n=1 Tax=Streptomyces longhuiensis TaxID=2880933 RepID=UPI001D09D4DA|nr:CDP-glycerol glycerophosphotransferase family protein [Streptomyces longhuiensis]UDL99833.1 CDP-glycerol glycerophosphotransferase family protein [Streptomyces longhuiensis]
MPSAGLAPRRVVQLSALFAMFALYTAQLVSALIPYVPVFVAASAAGLALDTYLQYKQPGLLSLLGKIRFDVTVRQLLRDMLILVGLLRIDGIEPLAEQSPLTIALLAFYALHFVCQAVAVLVRRTRALPIVTRNIDASELRLSAAPPRILARRQGHRLLSFAAPGTVGLLITAATTDALWGGIGLAVSIVLLGGGTVHLATWLLPKKRALSEQKVMAWLDRWLADYKPTVAMYFSGGTSSAYQANMWLSTLSEVDGKPLIVLRERFMVQKIDATDVPVICFPKVATMFSLENSTLKMVLHPANAAKTSQVLRIPTIKHAFINHGESDKLSSCNPYAKAYDEVWVAGPAARERYQLADIGVEDKDVVEVGRPQLSPIKRATGAPRGTYTTVLYAPTWEGWDGNPGNTSVLLAGENFVKHLLADDSVRLLYKPHPMTGSVDPRAGVANERIKAMVREAAAKRSGARPGPEAAAELVRRTTELDRLTSTAFRASADEMERMMLQGAPDGDRQAAVAEATAAWEAAYWASFPEWEHLVITDARPAIFTCFNQADVLISDVSSVVSDWLTSEKPYAVANTSGMSESDFRAGFPTVSAATILTPAATEVPALLAAVRAPETDSHAEARAELKEHLLGPSDPPSLDRFNDAVRALCDRADERRVRMESRLAAEIPGQRGTDTDADEFAEALDSDAESGDTVTA